MSTHSQYLPLSKVKAGMVLADDLLDKRGHVLLPAGLSLSEATLHAIAAHDIHQLHVESSPMSSADSAALQAHQLARLDLIFRQHPYTYPNSELERLLRLYRSGVPS